MFVAPLSHSTIQICSPDTHGTQHYACPVPRGKQHGPEELQIFPFYTYLAFGHGSDVAHVQRSLAIILLAIDSPPRARIARVGGMFGRNRFKVKHKAAGNDPALCPRLVDPVPSTPGAMHPERYLLTALLAIDAPRLFVVGKGRVPPLEGHFPDLRRDKVRKQSEGGLLDGIRLPGFQRVHRSSSFLKGCYHHECGGSRVRQHMPR